MLNTVFHMLSPVRNCIGCSCTCSSSQMDCILSFLCFWCVVHNTTNLSLPLPPSFPPTLFFVLLPFLSFVHFQLFDVVVRYDTLRNVINSGTRNLKSIVLTAVLAVILIFLYSIFGYVFFPDDFLLPTNPRESIEALNTCDGQWSTVRELCHVMYMYCSLGRMEVHVCVVSK